MADYVWELVLSTNAMKTNSKVNVEDELLLKNHLLEPYLS